MPTSTQPSALRVIGTGRGNWHWQMPCGRIVANVIFITRQSAEDCLPETIGFEWTGTELRGAS